jgi:hypothetical protein
MEYLIAALAFAAFAGVMSLAGAGLSNRPSYRMRRRR